MKVSPDFPERRREDLRRQAELAVYNELLNSARPGAIIQDVAHFGIQVKGGKYTVSDGSWLLEADLGCRDPVRDVIRKKLGRKVFVVGVLVFPDMEPNPEIEEWATSNRVRIIWGSHDLVELVEDEDIFSPPTAHQKIEQETAVDTPKAPGGPCQISVGDACVVNVHHYHGTVNMYNGTMPTDRNPLQSPSDSR